ncbi:uncharacterized protein BX664DRAFT_343404 [Halteromyces radiatus]|uniref:uncharacterized protein n=1 Tax=Halteromyces radiatus TaxID=101107 RepID=UPI00221F4245|nr:uncharacterized protein BX664DRAFT_343404 [Halteromyces radiatus]KAI8077755.1 hypothetical protein BX664DRAFT_343404 [Halteromyces radiatus]
MKSTMKTTDSLVYLDDYIDTIESLPLELQRNFTLLRELDGYAQELIDSTANEAIQLIDHIQDLNTETRLERLKNFAVLLNESLKRGEEKVALAKSTFDSVERHCNRLDANLVKFEDEYNGWTDRITSLPGMAPSSRFLKENIESKDRALSHFRRQERKDKGEKRDPNSKKRKIKETGTPPPGSSKQHVTKESKSKSNSDKDKVKTPGKHGNSKGKTVIPADLTIDPNEPLYCYCQQVSFGEMVGCDNNDCDLEWFHLACVDLKTVPKGKWYCYTCLSKMKGRNGRK